MAKAIIISLVAGGFGTALAEYFFHYQLIDLIVDKSKAVFAAIRGK